MAKDGPSLSFLRTPHLKEETQNRSVGSHPIEKQPLLSIDSMHDRNLETKCSSVGVATIFDMSPRRGLNHADWAGDTTALVGRLR